MAGIVYVSMNRMMVHCHQAKEVVITLKDSFRESMSNFLSNNEIFEIQTKYRLFHYYNKLSYYMI